MIFKLGAMVTVSAYTHVEADTLEQAIKIAEDREVEWSNGYDGVDRAEVWVCEQPDGLPQEIRENE